jgi:endonuclease G
MAKRNAPSPVGVPEILGLALILLLIAALVFFIYLQRRSARLAATQPPAVTTTATSTATSTATTAPAAPAPLITENGIVFAGLPRAAVPVTVIRNTAYIVGYSETRKDPLWVTYHVIHTDHPFHLERPKGNFVTDPRTRARTTHEDFTGSGFDRGHMAPNSAIARCFGPDAQNETFLLSNICPQAPALNQKVWEKLEADEQTYAERDGHVWVTDGPIFADTTGAGTTRKLRSGIAVPTAFYKILVEESAGRPRVFSVIMPQTVKGTELPGQYLTSINEIEKETGIQFLPDLPPAQAAALKAKIWPMW